MKNIKEQAEQLYTTLFGPVLVPQSDYITQIIHLMGLIRHNEQLLNNQPEQGAKRGRKPSNQTME